MKNELPVAGAFAAFASVTIGFALTLARDAYSQSNAGAAAELTRPGDVERWVTVGVTVRLDRQDRTTPWQMRQVSMAPDAYEHFVRTREFADGTAFAATFHALTLDTSHTPPLYHAADEQGFAMEVIDRAHPDGRRFYVFASGETRAAPLPARNECAVCHNAQGDFDGTFSDAYPAIRDRLGGR